GSFIGAGILYVIWKLMGSTQNYETAYRCLAYAYAITPVVTLLGFVPYLGLIGLVWMLYLLVVASVEVHGIAAKTAWIVFGILTVLLALFQISAYRTAQQMGQSGEAMQRNMGEFSKQMEQMQTQIEEEMKKQPQQEQQAE
ncbi:MAG: YIP1 family protein, partial [Gammaproteobacteria bacterium]